ncbi:hypothetical protein A3C89_04245 [Candidatus Kaiserbacteria bacterium RIFCSPHIGHO2_02_FULL_50_50]|uniref:Uncharacterized protein n=1 Tax=Candidatus Kaiserbacteria bacterium RIFCSPHIGHO2_02_FULL_50_50 TaxID=1798492 RepID=A0A1F6DDI3_9BACT|nr:MAG: hypothetical protein A3C89_04245 [Candidatus Kaiserbacteria bacterium RIFCSPHIGHO2_02_FULL_50_50]OGG89059.1 MAG: hypothetical protein A3G62_03975 [Candidatus Kaiserbacteria bacterium RIFCSPLOWO2_12_FULL_50_10]
MRLITLYILAVLFALPLVTQAAGLSVQFQNSPLFGEAQFMPGATVSRTVTVTNTDAVAHTLYTRATSTVSGGLEDAIDLTIISSASHFNGTLAAYYATSSVLLGTLASNETKTYTFGATFRTSAADAYQGKTTQFDIEVGWDGGEAVTDGSGGGTGSSGGTTSTGGGSGSFGVGGSGTGAEPRVLGDSTVADFMGDVATNVATIYNAGTKAVARVLGDEDIAVEATSTEEASLATAAIEKTKEAPAPHDCRIPWLIAFALMMFGRILLEVFRAREQDYHVVRASNILFLAMFVTAFAVVALLSFPCSVVTAVAVGLAYIAVMLIE